MTWAEKYMDTRTFHFENVNPKSKKTGDCVIRAIAKATGDTWDDTLDRLVYWMHKTRFDMSDPRCFNKYLTEKGFTMQRQPRKSDGRKYTGAQFCDYLNKSGKNVIVVANIGGHHTVAITRIENEYKVCDSWNSTDGCIGNYWVKNE